MDEFGIFCYFLRVPGLPKTNTTNKLSIVKFDMKKKTLTSTAISIEPLNSRDMIKNEKAYLR